MIYSASRRTDLVAFYPDWICTKVARSRRLEAIAFWTKDPRPLVDHPQLSTIVRDIPSIVNITITGLGGSDWESNVPHPKVLRNSLSELAARLPRGALRWRFDPILHDETLFERFMAVHDLWSGCTGEQDEVIVSFPDAYPAVRERLRRDGQRLPELTAGEQAAALSELHARSGRTLLLCCEPHLLDVPGTKQSHCIDGALFDRLYNTNLGGLPNDAGQRAACGCTRSTDIGSYADHPCAHNCRYCYANPLE